VEWIKIYSWHIVRGPLRMPERYLTLCGRQVTGVPAADYGNEATCESCLRIKNKKGS
jgi:hypothetical protein